MQQAYDFTFELLCIVMNLLIIFGMTVLVVGLVVVVYNLLKMIKE